jgi:uncharacterized membrane protein
VKKGAQKVKDNEKRFQIKLWFSSILGSIISFFVIRLIWNDVNPILLLVLLMVSFMINFIIFIRSKRKGNNLQS